MKEEIEHMQAVEMTDVEREREGSAVELQVDEMKEELVPETW